MSDFNNKLVIELFKQRDALKADVVRLTLKVAELYKGAEEQKRRIKRLEEAAQRVEDAAHSIQDWGGTVLGDALDELEKAKEAKP